MEDEPDAEDEKVGGGPRAAAAERGAQGKGEAGGGKGGDAEEEGGGEEGDGDGEGDGEGGDGLPSLYVGRRIRYKSVLALTLLLATV